MNHGERWAAMLREARIEDSCRPGVEAALIDAFRRKHARTLRTRWTAFALASAAALVLAVVWNRPAQAPSPNAPVAKREGTVAQSPVMAAVTTPDESRLSSSGPSVKGKVLRTTRPQAAHREVATPFFALEPVANEEPASGQMVRLRVPRATMASFGLPVNDELAEQRIDADVLIGNDGRARAIRFVRTIQ